MRALAFLVAGIVALPGQVAIIEIQDPPAEPPRPNIVIVLIDDAAPHDGRLWSSPTLTPTLADRFVQRGVQVAGAIGEAPLCCPGRASLLTGLSMHHHGVVDNDGLAFDPAVHVGSELREAGYTTMYIGKYLNGADRLTEADWDEHEAGWDHLDAIDAPNGRFFDYTVHTREGDVAYTDLHSTRMVADRTVQRLREARADKPIFAVLSIYDLHSQNLPMAHHAGSQGCATMPPWLPGNYDEADVSDKPIAVQALPPIGQPGGWGMVRYCEEMLGVEEAVALVTGELDALGRGDDTLMVFTADNGIGWGAHRVRQNKSLPYTTPVPLSFHWPARWGDAPRVIDEVVSSIDLAPTLCELGGCVMGPFADGQPSADGVSLLPLLDGTVRHLDRPVILEQIGPTPTWAGLRTTRTYPDGRWHYVEWATGEVELYDLVADPWELDNVAGSPEHADRIAELSASLAGLLRHASGATLDPRSVDAGAVAVGTTSSVDVTVRNDGPDPLVVGSLEVVGLGRAAFAADGAACLAGPIAAGGSCDVEVTFAPLAEGPRRAVLAVGVEGTSLPLRLPLSGTGIGNGSLRIRLDLLPDSATAFTFDGDLGAFLLDDRAGATPPKQRTFTDLPQGTYSVRQAGVSGWSLLGISCDGPATADPAAGTVSIDIAPGQHRTCTFSNVRRRPDLKVSRAPSGTIKGNDLYRSTPIPSQTVTVGNASPGTSHTFLVRVQNDGLAPDGISIAVGPPPPPGFSRVYRHAGSDVTAAVEAGTFAFSSLPPGGQRTLEVTITVAPDAAAGVRSEVVVTGRSTARPGVRDVVRMVSKVADPSPPP